MDDEVEVARSLARVLRREQLDVQFVHDAPAALQAIAEFQPELVVSDYSMPAMNGAELVREIQRRSPATACILLTGYANLLREGDGAGDAPCPMLSKPWDRPQLVAAVRAALGERPGRPP